MTKPSAHYPTVDANPDFAALEQQILQFWAENKTFEKSVQQRPAEGNSYVFYDGPPFANGLPHYGHLLTGYVKDAVARYQTMRGKRVERRFGWDCHGLPAEMGTEKELGITGRAAIIEYGIDKFNDYCRDNVMRYVADWEYYVTRQGRWVDFKNDYKTMDKNFMESVIWAFSELHKKGLVYEAFRVMPYSWAAETPLSNFETRMDNATREREDKAAYVKFKLKNDVPESLKREGIDGDCFITAWTTTPWTLPSNLALAIGDLKYVAGWFLNKEGTREEIYICADFSSAKIFDELEKQGYAKITGRTKIYDDTDLVSGNDKHRVTCLTKEELIGLTYEPLFPYFSDTKNAFRVINGGDAVTEGEGTGVIHMAPGFGEVDQKICAENGIEVIVPVDGQGKFTDAMYDIPWDSSSIRSPLVGEHASHWASGGGSSTQLTNARKMRKEPTPQESILWQRLKAEQLGGYKFRRQELIGDYIVDFVNYETGVVVEADGSQHADESDYERARTLFLESQGFRVLRFWNNEIDDNITGVLETILSALESPHGSLRSPAPPQGGSKDMLRLKGLLVVPDTRIPLSEIQVSAEDAAKHIEAKDVQKYGLANMRIVRWLKANNKLVKDEPYKHNYPHCWRTDTPIIYRAMSSWYVAVTKFRDRAVELNQQINWIPEHVKNGQMGHMLATAPDWSISRNRFWGTPIPIWRAPSGKVIVPGSIAEIETLSGTKVDDLHRPMIDNVTFERDGETYTRVEDVFDCWFESGSMPYAQLHYPFENKQLFEENFPADFITEYVGQTRGWFNTLIMLSTALFDKPPFQNCICHGVVIDEESGLKYSKRLKNYRDPKEVMDAYGADALRWMMLASPVMRGADIGVDPEGKFIRDVVRLNIKPLWSAYNFFTLYANADGVVAKLLTPSPLAGEGGGEGASRNAQPNVLPPHPTSPARGEGQNTLDRYILAKCKAAVERVQASLDAYDTPGATDSITGFFDVLNNWYIRRSRARFWGSDVTVDKQVAYDTLFTVLNLMAKAAAPLLPFTAEMVYRGLNASSLRTSNSECGNPVLDRHGVPPRDDVCSVHLQDFPDVSGLADEAELLDDIDWVRDICTAALAVRNKQNIRNRQPLQYLTIYGSVPMLKRAFLTDDYEAWKSAKAMIEDELNVKEVKASDDFDSVATRKLQINSQVLGKRLPAKMKEILPASKKNEWRYVGGGIEIANETLSAARDEYSIVLEAKPAFKDSAQPCGDNIVVLDLTITPELEAEGRARDLVRMIQQARKDSGFDVADRIDLALQLPAAFSDALAAHQEYIAGQVLAMSIREGAGGDKHVTQELDGEMFTIGLSKVA